MANNIKLNSIEWCNIIFEGRNKEYGAYEMRKTSSKRHIIAFSIVFTFTILLMIVPRLLQTLKPTIDNYRSSNITDQFVITEVNMDKPEEEIKIIEPRLTPPPPPLVKSIQFTPPVIAPDEDVTIESEVKSQEELNEFKGVISVATVETDNLEGVDIKDVLKEHREITGDGYGDGPIDFVEIMPQFPGGNQQLMEYLTKNLKYPTIAVESNIEGRVFLKFVVGKDGTISDVEILRGLDPSCDKEAVRVVQNMPKWLPGQQNGKPVAVYFKLPITFKLSR